MIPNIEFGKKGTTPNYLNAQEVDFSQDFVANEKTSA